MAEGKATDLGIFGDSPREQAAGLVSILREQTMSVDHQTATVKAAPLKVRRIAHKLMQEAPAK